MSDPIVERSRATPFEKGFYLVLVLVGVAVAATVGLRGYDLLDKVSYQDTVMTGVETIRSGDREAALAAADTIASLGSEAHAAVAPLAELARNEDAANRDVAILALGKLGGRASDAVPDLNYLFLDNDPAIRLAAVQAAGGIGIEARDTASDLADVLHFDSDPAVARAAVLALGDIVADDAESIAALVAALANRDEEMRADAALTLGRIGAIAAEAREPLLMMAVIEDAEYVRVRAAWAAAAVDPRSPSVDRETALALLRDPDGRARARAVEELATVAGNDARAVGALVESLDDPDASVRGISARALGTLGADAAPAIPLLIELLDDPDRAVQEEASAALETIRNAGGKTVN